MLVDPARIKSKPNYCQTYFYVLSPVGQNFFLSFVMFVDAFQPFNQSMQDALSIIVELGTMKVIMGAPHSAARLPSATLLSWASLSGSELSELLLNFH